MNCYTVTGGLPHLGIALSHDEARRTFCLTFGKKVGQVGNERRVYLAPRDPASYVLMAGGIYLMRTAKLLRVDEKNPEFVLGKAKHGLKADTADPRALVYVDFLSTSGSFCSTSKEGPVHGFEVLEGGGKLFRVQGLVILEPNQHFGYYDEQKRVGFVIAYDFNEQDRFPLLSCISYDQFRAREHKKLVVV
jgi:hypothetical protein